MNLAQKISKTLSAAILLFSICFSANLKADIWYVNKSGNDTLNGKTSVFTSGYDGPKLTIDSVLAYASGGDTVVIGRGFYNESIVLNSTFYFETDSVAIRKLTMNGSGNHLYLYGDSLEISDTLYFVEGVIHVQNPSFVFFCPFKCEVIGGTEISYVDGRLYRQLGNGAGTLEFPIGVGADFRPASMAYNQNIPDSRVHWMQVFTGEAPSMDALPSGIRNIGKRHYWEFNREGAGQSTDYIFTVDYSSTGLDDEVFNADGLRLLHSANTGIWDNLGGTGSSQYSGSINASNSTDTIGYLVLGNSNGYLNPLGGILPFAGFTVSGKCVNTSIVFSDTSLNMPPAKIVKWMWDFGDTSVNTDTSSLQNPSFTYDTAGLYVVKLIVENDSSLRDSAIVVVDIRSLPKPGISTLPSCFGQQAFFRDTSKTQAPDTVLTSIWDFGDGSGGSGRNANHTYATRDTFTVQLVVSSSAGCTDSIKIKTWVSPNPVAGFDQTAVCFKQTTSFTDTSKVTAPDAIVSYFWDFGDGSTHIIKNPTYTYSTSGAFTVKQTVTTNAGCIDSAKHSVTVHPLPEVFIENAEACFGQPSRFKDTSRIASPDTIKSRLWYLGDGSTATSKNISYIYGVAGNFNLKLVLTSGPGCKDSSTVTAVVNVKPSPDFVTGNVCENETSSFVRIKSVNPPDNQLTYFWYDNYTFVKSDTAYNGVLSGVGDHTITLIAQTGKGCRDSMVQNATVFGKPDVQFYLDKSFARNDSLQCLTTNNFTFIRSVTAGQSQLVNAQWIWGDGTTGTLADSSHSYNTQDTFAVKLLAVTDQNCSDSLTHNYIVRGTVAPQIGKIGVCTPDSIIFYDSASVSSAPVVLKQWKLSSGNTGLGDTFTHWMTTTGPIDVTLIQMTTDGCIDSITKTYTFTSYPVISFVVTGSMPFCPGDSIQVRADGGTNIQWIADNDTNRIRSFYTAGFKAVRAFNTPQCFADDSFQVIVYPPANIKAGNDTTIIRGDKAKLSATGGITYVWTPATSLNQNFGSVVMAGPSDSQTYVVTGTTIDGCTGSDTVTVRVVDREVIRIPNLITPNNDGQNDFWSLLDLPDLSFFDVTITDYAGKIVCESSNYKNDWNATKDGAELPEGIYYYRLVNRKSGEITKGFIQVIR